ncbi:MAG: hypothetical protein J0L76_20070 [Rhodobacterales bacterium]|nr:hypothetical protein [Rhodobacterales bacterium]
MKIIAFAAATAILSCASQASAEDKKFAGYVIKAKTETVEGVLLVDGYSPEELVSFLREDCASGEIGSLSYVGKPYKKRGNTFQKFKTTCVGGPSPRIGATSAVSVEVERMPDGRNMTEYTYGANGDLQYTRYIR